jgi:hypothetical protein
MISSRTGTSTRSIPWRREILLPLGCHITGSKSLKMVMVKSPQTPAKWAIPESLDTKMPPSLKKFCTATKSSIEILSWIARSNPRDSKIYASMPRFLRE